jgi:3-dehydroquinate dehydratase-1/3-dehydroquinate dehydratase/shikimate dehydrogenase
VPPFLEALSVPLLFTNRPCWEGGNCADEERGRIVMLQQAARSGAAYVDIELRADEGMRRDLIAAARQGSAKVVVSWHDFSGTPCRETLAEIFDRQAASGADIGKIVTTACCFEDVLRVLDLQAEAAAKGFSLIAFCMGQAGVISRLATLELGGYMTYVAPDGGRAAAPGQLPLSALLTMRRLLHESH